MQSGSVWWDTSFLLIFCDHRMKGSFAKTWYNVHIHYILYPIKMIICTLSKWLFSTQKNILHIKFTIIQRPLSKDGTVNCHIYNTLQMFCVLPGFDCHDV